MEARAIYPGRTTSIRCLAVRSSTFSDQRPHKQKDLITDVAAEIEQIGGAYYADDVAEILRRLADGKKPDFLPAPHSAGLVKIVVNMVEHEVPLATTISYEQVAELAGKPGATHLTMTHHTSKYGGGSLIAGESTRLRAGMHFTAVFTGNA